jgi:hypothetical protein
MAFLRNKIESSWINKFNLRNTQAKVKRAKRGGAMPCALRYATNNHGQIS